ncbi:hypothetical protein AWB81_01349 [Caballeronia arationis]|jgi:hypothetical protein|uniref:Uncharacterized protein n=1 Tax=Caballeronia arationis TaxID=1777142 RepID=A0A7Z7N3M0_9BURK|nr:hypothetical protein [Caballeronia arationis]SAK55197.1 hypothetical protein AWB81_01349 [Caballeronia arationis]SOE81129.1 hypothetical protein SAMN05446927_4392 [Caballeronia arationis]
MHLLWIFIALCPFAFAALVAFAAHINPLSGHWQALKPHARRGFGGHARLRAMLASHAGVIACSE